jgi:hypothetical protein
MEGPTAFRVTLALDRNNSFSSDQLAECAGAFRIPKSQPWSRLTASVHPIQ